MADLKSFIAKVAGGEPLDRNEARSAFGVMMSGDATPSQIGGFLMALRNEDVAHLVLRKVDPMSLGRDSPRWQRALRALSLRVATLRHHRREKIHQLVPPVEQIAPHLLGPDPEPEA